VDGPLAFDNAIRPRSRPDQGHRLAGGRQADILLVPDLEAGNMLAKQPHLHGQRRSAGIVLGARVPIILTSRADSVMARLASCAVAAFVVQARRARPPAACHPE
jgi:phosphate acetyltransferase